MINTIMDRIEKGKFVLIAEAGVNYYDIAEKMNISNMDAAKLMIREAKDAGIHAIKFQTYKAGTLAAKDSPYYWDITEESTRSQFELFSKFDLLNESDYQELADYSNSLGLEFLSTAFDFESADYLDKMMNVYKISSSDLSNLPFIEYQAKKGKPIILSIGASNADEIDTAVQTIEKYNSCPITLLHCVLEYPTPYADTNLLKIASLKERYSNAIIGYSDHAKPKPGYDVIKTAYMLGAKVIEKHYTLDKTLKGNDHYHAMDPIDAKNILEGIDLLDTLCGCGDLKCLDTEKKARANARRSVVSKGFIPKGTEITSEMLTYKRPGTGISPTEVEKIIGKISCKNIDDDTILSWEMFN